MTTSRPYRLRPRTSSWSRFGKHATKTNALQSLVIASFVRGLSVRDVEATLAEALGDQAARSPSRRFPRCARRSGPNTGSGRGAGSTCSHWTICSWTLASFGCIPGRRPSRSSPPGTSPPKGNRCSSDSPLVAASQPTRGPISSPTCASGAWTHHYWSSRTGRKGLIAAVEEVFPQALRQRCLIHRLRNIAAKIPTGMQPEIRDGYWALFDTIDLNVEPGPRLVELVDKRIDAFAAKYRELYPAAMQLLLTDRKGLSAYLRFPTEHHCRIRHSNLIERAFGETKRRTKVIGRLPGEPSAVSLVWAVLDRASAGWRGVAMTPAGARQLQDLRRSLLEPPRQLLPAGIQEAADHANTAEATA